MQVLRSKLISTFRQLGDVENETAVIPDTLVARWLDDSIAGLLDLLRKVRGANYFLTSISRTADGVSHALALPDDLVSIDGVSVILSGNRYIKVHSGESEERSLLLSLRPSIGLRYRYLLMGAQAALPPSGGGVVTHTLEIYPLAPAGTVFSIFYLPALVRQVESGDAIYDGVNGWEMFAVYDVLAKFCMREERDPSGWLSQREEMRARIQALAPKRDADAPPQQRDVQHDLHTDDHAFDVWPWRLLWRRAATRRRAATSESRPGSRRLSTPPGSSNATSMRRTRIGSASRSSRRSTAWPSRASRSCPARRR